MKPSDVDIHISFAGHVLQTPIYNASGVWCTNVDELKQLSDCEFTGAIVAKSCTLLPRQGNPSPRYCGWRQPDTTVLGSINSMGLPNFGLEYYARASRDMPKPKPFFLSVSGLTRDETLQMMSQIQFEQQFTTAPISGVELNLSCPNVPGKPQTCYDMDAMDETLRQVTEFFDRIPLGVKLAPYFDPAHWDEAADVLRRYSSKLSWVTCINSIGNGLVVNAMEESVVIHPKAGLGGIGGATVKPTALANVREFRKRLPDSVAIIGCGGVTRGMDVFEHILCGAEAVQIGTWLAEEGPDVFYKTLHELRTIMAHKGYQSLEDFRGKLKEI